MKKLFRTWYEITVDNSAARSFNINIDRPSWGCFAWSKDEAINKFKDSDFQYKHLPIIHVKETN